MNKQTNNKTGRSKKLTGFLLTQIPQLTIIIIMRVIKTSFDEQNRHYSVTLENGKTYFGYKALNGIRIRKVKNEKDKETLEAYVDWRYIKNLKSDIIA